MPYEAALLQKVLDQPLSALEPSPPRLAKQQQKRLAGEELTAFCEAYRAQLPIEELAAQFGISRSTVRDLVIRHGLPRRHPILSPDQVAEAARLYQSGQSLASIATVLPASDDAIGDALVRAGFTLRPRGRRRRSSLIDVDPPQLVAEPDGRR
jgi:methylphosphotriester-DNA--protein-cysteine methyltransferase